MIIFNSLTNLQEINIYIYEDVLSSYPSSLSSSEFLIQEEICADQNFEFSCKETLNSHDLSVEVKNSVEQVCCLGFDEHVQKSSNEDRKSVV